MKLNPSYFIILTALLISSWPDGEETFTPATNMKSCIEASEAYLLGIGVPENKKDQKAISSYCKITFSHDSGFAPGWDCIKNYNCTKAPR